MFLEAHIVTGLASHRRKPNGTKRSCLLSGEGTAERTAERARASFRSECNERIYVGHFSALNSAADRASLAFPIRFFPLWFCTVGIPLMSFKAYVVKAARGLHWVVGPVCERGVVSRNDTSWEINAAASSDAAQSRVAL